MPCISFVRCLNTLAKLRRTTISFVMSVRLSAWNNCVPTGGILMKFDIWILFENLSWKFKFHKIRPRITGNLLEDQHTFMITYRTFHLRMRNVSDKIKENQNAHFMFYNTFFSKIILWKNIVNPNKPQMTIWRVPTACWIPKATNKQTHTQRICNTYFLYTATIVIKMRLHVTLYVNLPVMSYFKIFSVSWWNFCPPKL